jgi:predicted phage baseplate assembly protein
MPILLPNLDDRRWADLVEQGRALIPLFSPEWTDHNASDPGITLMELFAWIAEMDIYRLNRIPDRHKRRLLALMGVCSEPPRPARGVVELHLPAGSDPATLPAAAEFLGTRPDGTQVTFRSVAPLTSVSARLRVVQRHDAGGFQNFTASWSRLEAFPVFGDNPVPGAALYLGFDDPLPPDQWVSLYFQFAGPRTDREERRRIVAETASAQLPPAHSVRVAWEYLAAGSTQWESLDSEDDTRSMTLDGAVRLRAGDMALSVVGKAPQPYHYIRCRFSSGAHDAPPAARRILANAVEIEQAAPMWQTLPIAKGAPSTGSASPGDRVRLHMELRDGVIQTLSLAPAEEGEPAFTVLNYIPATAYVSGILTLEARLIGFANGEPSQTIVLPRYPAVEASVGIYSLESSTWIEWRRVDDFAASPRPAAHFLLEPAAGEVTLGDGEQGRTAMVGSPLFAVYDSTEAEHGSAGISGLADTPHNRAFVTDPGAADLTIGEQISPRNGLRAETLGHATGRAIQLREGRLRAVTVEDFETLALETPGTHIARARAWPNLFPGLDCVTAPGVVSVAVVPAMPGPRPTPSAGLLRVVAARLDQRRTIGTRILVVSPSYLEVSVKARVKAFESANKLRLRRQVSDAIDAFFHPLRGGPDGTGWPFGRDIFRSEVLKELDETAGVDHVLTLELIAEGCPPNCGNVCLRPNWLVASGQHEIEVE